MVLDGREGRELVGLGEGERRNSRPMKGENGFPFSKMIEMKKEKIEMSCHEFEIDL